jgi:hypothetical protein
VIRWDREVLRPDEQPFARTATHQDSLDVTLPVLELARVHLCHPVVKQ